MAEEEAEGADTGIEIAMHAQFTRSRARLKGLREKQQKALQEVPLELHFACPPLGNNPNRAVLQTGLFEQYEAALHGQADIAEPSKDPCLECPRTLQHSILCAHSPQLLFEAMQTDREYAYWLCRFENAQS